MWSNTVLSVLYMFSIENKTKEKMERRYAALFNDDLL